MEDLIKRKDAIHALGEKPNVYTMSCYLEPKDLWIDKGRALQWEDDVNALLELQPSTTTNFYSDARLIYMYGLESEIRCAMCTNPNANDRGCDGNCIYDERLYKEIIEIIEKRMENHG